MSDSSNPPEFQKRFNPPPAAPGGWQQGPPPGSPPVAPPPMPQPPAGYGYGVPQWGPPGKVRNIGVSILLAIVTLGIYTYVWTWMTQEEIKRHSGVGVGGALGFVIYFIFSPITYFLIPYEINQMMQRAGRQSRVSAVWGLWILLPIIGIFVWFIRVQGQLNDYWRSLGAPG